MDNIRFILIVTFVMLVILLQQAWELDYGPKPPVAAVDAAAAQAKADLPDSTTLSGQQAPASNAPVTAASIPVTQAAPAAVIKISTDVLALEVDLQGATVRSLDLLQYPVQKDNTIVNQVRSLIGLEASEKDYKPVRLLNPAPERLFEAQSGLIAGPDSAVAPSHYSNFVSEKDHYVLPEGQDTLTVPVTWTDNNGLVVTKTFVLKRGSYEVTLEQNVSNNTGKAWLGRQYSQLLKVPFKEGPGGFLTGGLKAYDGGVVYTEKDKYKKVSFDDMENDNLDTTSAGGWVAMIQHYFATAWIPPADQENHFYTKHLNEGRFLIGSFSPMTTVENNSSAKFVSHLFSGPKIQPMMESVAKGLELTVDYSVLTFIGKPIYSLLNQIHNLAGNWGVAIIGVTLTIKLLFFPLSQAGFKSMARMRKVQPRLKELQERFADDRPRFNQEMMEMYKKEKVNPLGGCLPIFVQIPVFMSLYWVLSETVEFRQAPFLLWVQDLSVEDPFYVLPVIMGITMKIQQGLNPPPLDPIQAKVMRMFPIVFTVFFLFFPAGLVLYWIVNNTLSILQQTYITQQIAKNDK